MTTPIDTATSVHQGLPRMCLWWLVRLSARCLAAGAPF